MAKEVSARLGSDGASRLPTHDCRMNSIHRPAAPRAGGETAVSKPFNPFEMAQAQFDKVADILDLDSGTRDLLRWPMREHQFAIPVRMDDGKVKVFRGFRVQHNDARGPEQGRHPLPSARDAGHGARAGDVDDLEVRGGRHPARRRQGRRHLRPAPPEHARAGSGSAAAGCARWRRTSGYLAGRAGARRDDQSRSTWSG